MNRSIILSTATRLLFGLLFMFSVFLLLRGHNHPGGGFIGGLVAASAFILLAMSFRMKTTKEVLRVDPLYIVGTGLLLAVVSGVPSIVSGEPFMKGMWIHFKWSGTSMHLGTPLLFDLGVFLLVIGFTLVVVFSFEERR